MVNVKIEESKFIPIKLEAQSQNELAKFFDGPIPEIGDKVEMFCYSKGETNVCLKWRVVQNVQHIGKTRTWPSATGNTGTHVVIDD